MVRESSALLRHVGFFLAALAVLMASIDGTITVVALPQLTESLGTSLALVGWTLTSYQLVQIVMYPLAGQLSDMFGRRRVFLFCVITFTVSSLLCGLAPNVFVLIVFRAVQAIGGGGLLPSVIGLIAEEYREHRGHAEAGENQGGRPRAGAVRRRHRVFDVRHDADRQRSRPGIQSAGVDA